METNKKPFMKRCVMMITGILFIGICVGAFRLSAFGVDAFTCMNLGISGFIHMSFGNWQLIMNGAILVLVFFTIRHCIGAGTIVNMVGVGYMADFICWLFHEALKVEMVLPLRIVALVIGCLFAGLGVSFYMVAEMGIAPYDSVALIIEKWTQGKIPFQYARVVSDVTVVIIGVVFCLLSGGELRLIIGIGTICNALFNGPLIQFCKVHVALPIMEGRKCE
jgi:uncharacterized membrane protein YczE